MHDFRLVHWGDGFLGGQAKAHNTMGSISVVMVPLAFDNGFGRTQWARGLAVEQFVPHSAL